MAYGKKLARTGDLIKSDGTVVNEADVLTEMHFTKRFSNGDILAVAGTAQLVINTTETQTFVQAVKMIRVYPTLDAWIAKTTALAGTPESGKQDDRHFCPKGQWTDIEAWDAADIAFVNVHGTELPTVHVVGYA